MTERNHRLLASTLVVGGSVSLHASPSSCSLNRLQYHWCYCQVVRNFEASLESIIIGNSWWVPTADWCIKQMSLLLDKLSHRLSCSYQHHCLPLVLYRSLPRPSGKEGGCWGSRMESLYFKVVVIKMYVVLCGVVRCNRVGRKTCPFLQRVMTCLLWNGKNVQFSA
jgi:hypothetical protein